MITLKASTQFAGERLREKRDAHGIKSLEAELAYIAWNYSLITCKNKTQQRIIIHTGWAN